MVPVSLRAAAKRPVEVIDLRTLFPWDRETVIASVERTGRLLVVQEPQGSAGIASEVVATVAEKCLYSLRGTISRVTGFDAPWPQFAIEKHALVNERRIATAIDQALNS
jgi:pyruvate dehydrogenase E1 component beta subunit